MTYPTKLRSLLASGPFAPMTVQPAADLCDAWFAADAGPSAFTCRAVFRDLLLRGWDDQQGVPTAEFDPFVNDVLPRIVAVLAAPQSPPPTAEIAALVLAYHSSLP